AGRIEGYVRDGLTPVQAFVRATLVPSRSGDAARFDVKAANDGSYQLDVPTGRYVLGVLARNQYEVDYEYSAAGLRAGDAPPDTLLVTSTATPIHADFDMASLRVHLELSPELDGESATLVFHRVGAPPPDPSHAYLFEHDENIQDGVIDPLIRGILPGTYKLEVVLAPTYYQCPCPYEREHFWWPGVQDVAASPSIELGGARVGAVSNRLGPAPARIQGQITGAWQNMGIGQPLLGLFGLDSTVVRNVHSVSSDGSFDERVYFARPVKLLVWHAGIGQWAGGSTFEAATVFDLHAGQVVSGVRYVESGAMIDVSNDDLFPWLTVFR